MTNDTGATIAGGGAGLALLLTVRWELIPMGEAVKVGAALALILIGYFCYRQPGPPSSPVTK